MTVALSCSVNDFESEAVVNATESQEFSSIESALSSLEDFIRKNYPSTKSFVIDPLEDIMEIVHVLKVMTSQLQNL